MSSDTDPTSEPLGEEPGGDLGKPGPDGFTRRQFLAGGLVLGAAAALGLGLYSSQVEPFWLQFVARPLPVRDLPRELEGARLVQLSDIHVGDRVSDSYLVDTFRRVQALDPDIVVVTGDFVTYDTRALEKIDRVYSHLPQGRLGTYGVLGNHDYGHGWSHPDIAEKIVGTLERHGLHILRNQSVDVAGLHLVGCDDLWAKRFDPVRAFSTVPAGAPAVALVHNPDAVDERGWGDFAGWTLSGHTHGGQCKPPFLPAPLVPVEDRRYTAGAIPLSRGRQLYINRGVGFIWQVRFDVRPEVTVFELRSA